MRKLQPSAIGWTFAVLGMLYYVGAIAFSAIVTQPKQEDIGKEEDRRLQPPGIRMMQPCVAVVVGGPLFFRGFLLARLYSRWSLWPSALLSPARSSASLARNRDGSDPRARRRARLALQQDWIDLGLR